MQIEFCISLFLCWQCYIPVPIYLWKCHFVWNCSLYFQWLLLLIFDSYHVYTLSWWYFTLSECNVLGFSYKLLPLLGMENISYEQILYFFSCVFGWGHELNLCVVAPREWYKWLSPILGSLYPSALLPLKINARDKNAAFDIEILKWTD